MSALLRHPRLRPAAAALLLSYPLADLLLPSVFGIASVLTGVAVTTIAATLGAQRLVARAPAVLLAAAGIALALTGIPIDGPLSVGLTTLFIVFGAVAVFLIGAGTTLSVPSRALLAAAGAVALIGHFGVVAGSGMDRLVPYPVLAGVLLLGVLSPRDAEVSV